MKYITPETKSLQVNGQDLLVSFGVNETSSPTPSAPDRMSLPSINKTTGSW